VAYDWVKHSLLLLEVKKTSLVTPVAFPDDDKHFEIDPHETPDLPWEERAHEECDPRWLRSVEGRLHLCLLLRVFGYWLAHRLLRNQRPSGPQAGLIKKHMVEQDLDPVSGQADLSHGVIQIASVFRIFLEVWHDWENNHGSRCSRKRV